MLVRDEKILKQALLDLDTRTLLIQQLESRGYKYNHFSCSILAFWLGSSKNPLNVYWVQGPMRPIRELIFQIYYCILLIDMSASSKESEKTAHILRKCQFKILNYYNHHPADLLNAANHSSIKKFLSFINDLDKDSVDVRLKKIKQQCIKYLTVPLPKDHETQIIVKKLNEHSHWLSYFLSIKNINIFANKFITNIRYPFHFYFPDEKGLTANKFFLKADDGIYLDALFVKKAKMRSKYIVLATVGHFGIEHSYISNAAAELSKLFNVPIVFINHRNYSNRSAYLAENYDRLVQDIICFARHYKNQQKQIILYGMCGGAAFAISAAHLLMQEKIKFKLIADRFPQKYIDFVTPKNVRRIIENESRDESIKPSLWQHLIRHAPYHYIILPFYFLLTLLFKLTNTDRDFGQIIKALPEEDVLTLQIKSEKSSTGIRKYADLLIHPENDIRTIYKKQRHENKSLLKQLHFYANALSKYFHHNSQFDRIFSTLAKCFTECIELIDNEKLTWPINHLFNHTTDLHSSYLFNLTTRHHLRISQFLCGFFKQSPQNNLLNQFKDLHFTAIDQFYDFVKQHLISEISTMSHSDPLAIEIISDYLYNFFKLLSKHCEFLVRMTNRLIMTSLSNINEPLDVLFASNFRLIIFQDKNLNSHKHK